MNDNELFEKYPSAKTILDTMDKIGKSLDYFTERINRVKIVPLCDKENSPNNSLRGREFSLEGREREKSSKRILVKELMDKENISKSWAYKILKKRGLI